MAALLLTKNATYTAVHDTRTMDTPDNEDHTFCGVMFDVAARNLVPVEYVVVQSVWVRGYLGPMTVWSTAGGFRGKEEAPHKWARHYEKVHDASPRAFVELVLDEPIRIAPGRRVGVYVHSTRPDDRAVVYDDACDDRGDAEDLFVRVLPGVAHLSNEPFSPRGVWWGSWRGPRAFVGRLNLGVRYALWAPPKHKKFPPYFREAAMTLLLCNTKRRTLIGHLSPEIILYVLNMCRYDWFEVARRKRRSKPRAVAASVTPRDARPVKRSRRASRPRAVTGDDDDDDGGEDVFGGGAAAAAPRSAPRRSRSPRAAPRDRARGAPRDVSPPTREAFSRRQRRLEGQLDAAAPRSSRRRRADDSDDDMEDERRAARRRSDAALRGVRRR